MTTAAEMVSLVVMMAAALAVATALASSSSYFFFAAAVETATTTQAAVAAANSFFSQTGGFHQSPCFHVFPIIPKLLQYPAKLFLMTPFTLRTVTTALNRFTVFLILNHTVNSQGDYYH